MRQFHCLPIALVAAIGFCSKIAHSQSKIPEHLISTQIQLSTKIAKLVKKNNKKKNDSQSKSTKSKPVVPIATEPIPAPQPEPIVKPAIIPEAASPATVENDKWYLKTSVSYDEKPWRIKFTYPFTLQFLTPNIPPSIGLILGIDPEWGVGGSIGYFKWKSEGQPGTLLAINLETKRNIGFWYFQIGGGYRYKYAHLDTKADLDRLSVDSETGRAIFNASNATWQTKIYEHALMMNLNADIPINEDLQFGLGINTALIAYRSANTTEKNVPSGISRMERENIKNDQKNSVVDFFNASKFIPSAELSLIWLL